MGMIEDLYFMTPEEIKNKLNAPCIHKTCYDCKDYKACLRYTGYAARAYIEQLEEQVMCMKIQMHGDCGVCKHRSEQEAVFRKAAKNGEFAFTQRCEDCIKNVKSSWEYEGLPELPKKGATT